MSRKSVKKFIHDYTFKDFYGVRRSGNGEW